MIVKNMKKYFTFEVQVLDDKNVRRRFRASNYQSTTRVRDVLVRGLPHLWRPHSRGARRFTEKQTKKGRLYEFYSVYNSVLNADNPKQDRGNSLGGLRHYKKKFLISNVPHMSNGLHVSQSTTPSVRQCPRNIENPPAPLRQHLEDIFIPTASKQSRRLMVLCTT